jgi:hypothetical protein
MALAMEGHAEFDQLFFGRKEVNLLKLEFTGR